MEGLADFAHQWQLTGCVPGNIWCSEADYDRNGSVTVDDLLSFADEWLVVGGY